jgi:phage repressor protein C with HTH and peptisase S24 domain
MNENNSLSYSIVEGGSLGERLQTLIGDDSVRTFASKVGVSETMIRKYLKGGMPGLDIAARMAELCEVNLHWLATGRGPRTLSDDVHEYAPVDEEAKILKDDFELIDGYHVTIDEVGCGLDNLEVRRRLAFRKKWLEWRGLSADCLKIFFVKSYLENGLISGGDSVMINTADTVLADGVFAIEMEGGILIRWFSYRVDGSIEVYKDINQELSEVIGKDDTQKIKVLGRVVWVGKDFK